MQQTCITIHICCNWYLPSVSCLSGLGFMELLQVKPAGSRKDVSILEFVERIYDLQNTTLSPLLSSTTQCQMGWLPCHVKILRCSSAMQ